MRSLVDGEHRMDEHQQEHRREQEGIERGLHRQQVHHQEESHRTQRVDPTDNLVGSQYGVEEHGLETHQQHGEDQHGRWPEIEDACHKVIKRGNTGAVGCIDIACDERGNPQHDDEHRDGEILDEVTISEKTNQGRLEVRG